jgi:uncharacterized protein YaaN involved in tellurite resistance
MCTEYITAIPEIVWPDIQFQYDLEKLEETQMPNVADYVIEDVDALNADGSTGVGKGTDTQPTDVLSPSDMPLLNGVTLKQSSTALDSIDPQLFKSLGVRSSDADAVFKLAATITIDNPNNASSFGAGIMQQGSHYTETILSGVKVKDFETTGDTSINEILGLVRNSNDVISSSDKPFKQRVLGSLSGLPVIGGFAKRGIKLATDHHDKYQTVQTQLTALTQQLSQTQEDIHRSNGTLDVAYGEVENNYYTIGVHIAAGRIALQRKAAEVDALRQRDLSPLETQRLSDLESAMAIMDKRLGDMSVVQQATLQALPSIRIIQANDRMMAEKIQTICELTIPLWTQIYWNRVALYKQKERITAIQAVDDYTNQMLIENGTLLKQNSIGTAKANQRMVIDVETLEKTQQMLFDTVKEVKAIRVSGITERKNAMTRLDTLQTNMTNMVRGRPVVDSTQKQLH